MVVASAYSFSTHYHHIGDPAELYFPSLPVPSEYENRGTEPGQLPGHHLIVECYDASHLTDIAYIERGFREAIALSRATIINMSFHRFGIDQGITGVAMLAESHLSVHTWPESGYCAIDIFMCGSCDPRSCLPAIAKLFEPRRLEIASVIRGVRAIDAQAEFMA